MMTREFDPALMFDRLRGSVTQAVGNDLIDSGHGTHCGHCEKPFTAVRKPRGVARVSHGNDELGVLCQTVWVLCGSCRADFRRDGKRLSFKLMEEARASSAAWLLLTPPIRPIK